MFSSAALPARVCVWLALLLLQVLHPVALAAEEFVVRGTVRRLTADRQRVLIAHEEIPGYMRAMTMEFTPASGTSVAELVPGDQVEFRLVVGERSSRIDRLRKTGRVTPAPEPPAKPKPAITVELPEVRLQDQTGRAFTLSELRGKAVALTFIFTRCPLPDYCPLMNRNFLALQEALAKSPAGSWRMLSVSMDPAHDTPEVLAAYARGYEADPQRWQFATGSLEEVRRLGAACGLEFSGESAQLTHNLRTLVIDPAGRVRRVFEGNRWRPAELIEEMRRALP
ncbi:MAG: SCO family protein [Verrucomicrobia bacterium]|nr:SCO family protein [Verrucomicrobiota bacterium]